MTPFINYSRFFDLHNLSDDKRQQYNYSLVKFYSPVTQNYLPASNLGAITERLDDLI
ncbi:unnamed protein product, partial [Rotaria sordida]